MGDTLTREQAGEIRQLNADINNEPRRRAKHAALKREFDRLPEEAKLHYRTMRDTYKQRHDEYRRLLEQTIETAISDQQVKRRRIAELKTQFELQAVTAPYFPLARFGAYYLSAVDEHGEKRFMMFDSEKAQQDTLKKLKAQGFDARGGYKFDDSTGLDGAGIGFITDLTAKVDDSSLSDVKKEELKDTIYQLYLAALPSRSMRKQFLHRKKTKGWSNDALRALASNMMKSAYQLARLEYSDALSRKVTEAKKAARDSGNNQAGRYAEELVKRHAWVMNPTHSRTAQTLTSVGFVWMLGVSPAAAAVNTTQNFVVALPILASKYGLTRAAGALLGTMNAFLLAKGKVATRLTDSDEKAAYRQWQEAGLLDATRAHDLAGMAEAENWQYNAHYEKAMQWVSFLFHKAEVFNRETTALAAYRLAREDGKAHQEPQNWPPR